MSFTSVFVLHIKTHMASKQISKDRTSIFTPFVHLDIDLQQVYMSIKNVSTHSQVEEEGNSGAQLQVRLKAEGEPRSPRSW